MENQPEEYQPMENEPIENQPAPLFGTALRYGLGAALIMIVLQTLFNLLGTQGSYLLGVGQFFAFLALVIGISIFTIRNYRDNELMGLISFGQGFKLSFITLLTAGVILAFYSTIYVTMIDSAAIDAQIEEAIMDLEDAGMGDDERDLAIRMINFFRSPIIIFLSSLVYYAIGSAIVSLIGALVMKKEGPQGGFNA